MDYKSFLETTKEKENQRISGGCLFFIRGFPVVI